MIILINLFKLPFSHTEMALVSSIHHSWDERCRAGGKRNRRGGLEGCDLFGWDCHVCSICCSSQVQFFFLFFSWWANRKVCPSWWKCDCSAQLFPSCPPLLTSRHTAAPGRAGQGVPSSCRHSHSQGQFVVAGISRGQFAEAGPPTLQSGRERVHSYARRSTSLLIAFHLFLDTNRKHQGARRQHRPDYTGFFRRLQKGAALSHRFEIVSFFIQIYKKRRKVQRK